MRFSPLLLLAQAAALSSAFLVPPEISDDDLKGLELLMPPQIGSELPRIIRVPCDGCEYKEKGVKTDLVFDFSLPDREHHAMKVNGVPIFPLESIDPSLPLTAVQMPHEVDTIVYMVDRGEFPVVKLDNSRMITTDEITKDGSKIYTLELNVLAVSGTPVVMQGIEMTINMSPDGALSFGSVRAIPKGEGCGRNFKCLANKMMTKLRNMKTPFSKAKGKFGCGGNPIAEGLDMPPPSHGRHRPHHSGHSGHGRHGGHRHPHSHKYHHRPHHRGIFHRIVFQVLLPILVGIVAGMTVSLVGLAIGHVLVNLYRKVKGIKCEGRSRRGYFCRRRSERARLVKSEADGEVEKGLLNEGEVVECPPAYVEEGIEVAEKE